MTPQLDHCRVLFPDWFDERAEWEAESKGWLQGVSVEREDGRRYPVFFYDPVRLSQDLDAEAATGTPCLAEPGMIVVPSVTREAICRAVAHLSATGYFQHFRGESAPVGPPRTEVSGLHPNVVPAPAAEPIIP